MQGHVDLRTEAGEMFVDRVVEHLKDAVMETAFIAMETAQSKIKQQQSTINGLWTNSSSSK